MLTKIADEFAAIALRLAKIEAAVRLLRALSPSVTPGPLRQTELTIEDLCAAWRATP